MLKTLSSNQAATRSAHSTQDWRCVWITGASSGVGRLLAIKLAEQGVQVAASARSPDKLAELATAYANITAYPLDVTDAVAVANTAHCIASDLGPIDLAILNAGIFRIADPLNYSAAQAAECMHINYQGVANCIEPLVEQMSARSAGHIAIMASVAGYRGLPDCATYGPSKAALINLAEALKLGLAPQGIDVTIINPGYIDTPMTVDNTFEMPFIVDVEDAATRILRGLKKVRYEIAFPRPLVAALKFGRLMRNAGYFRYARWFLVKRNPRQKPAASQSGTEEQPAADTAKQARSPALTNR